MRIHSWFILFAAAAWPCLAQTTAPTPTAELPKDPRAVFDLARPLYDFSDPALKPWHLKASYQIYDEKGASTMKGTFEYWWASPKLWRVRWTRPDAEHNEWHTADGKIAELATGGNLNYYEYRLRSALLEPLPKPGDLDPDKFWLKREEIKLNPNASVGFPCIEVMPHMNWKTSDVSLGLFPTYCFDPSQPVLRFQSSLGNLSIQYSRFGKTQNHILAQEVLFQEHTRKILTAQVDQINAIASTNEALTPSADAKTRTPDVPPSGKGKKVVAPGEMQGKLLSKVQPVYPGDAEHAHITGTVVLKAIIGRDGQVHELNVLSAPWPSLAASALQAVSQWRYKPYMINGDPADIETTVNVVYEINH